MRQCTRKPIEDMQIDRIELELDSRDDIPQIIGGLQYIFLNPVLREEVLTLLDQLFPEEVDLNNGRPGMDRWSIFVMGVLRLNLYQMVLKNYFKRYLVPFQFFEGHRR
jgi:hypothetical protein